MLAVDAMSARHCQAPGFLMAEPDNAAEILRRATSRRTRTGAANAIDAALVKRADDLMGSLEGSPEQAELASIGDASIHSAALADWEDSG